MRLVLFDIDGTLVSGASSERRFARYLWRNRLIRPWGFVAYSLFFALWAPRYGRRVAQLDKAYLHGHRLSTLRQLADDFVRNELRPALFEPALARLQQHQKVGDTVALLSGTPQFIVDALAAELGVLYGRGAIVATHSGRPRALQPPTRHPHGPSKIDAAYDLAHATARPLTSAWAYGDSPHDRYLFHVVERAIVVGGDQKLDDLATQNGWEMLGDSSYGTTDAL